MLFNSYQFIIFFPVVVLIYFLLKKVKHRRIILLAASWYFYMAWKPEYIFLLAASTAIDYFMAVGMEKADKKSKRKKFLIISIISNLSILFSFKYFNFFSENFSDLINIFDTSVDLPVYNILLPVGISFYTFQTLSYSIDVYYGRKTAEKDFIKFALFVSFFPQLVAGPIERAKDLLPQFDRKAKFEYKRVTAGIKLAFWGFFQKIVIADTMAQTVDAVYALPEGYRGLDIILATFFFAIQIYCDFSGYTDIARGIAKILGYDLKRNFNYPYFAKSFAGFWHRWHISLSTWFRDYVFYPLCGKGSKTVRRLALNIFITFLLSGLWHGAAWNFVIWGALHGILYLSEKAAENIKVSFINTESSVFNVLKIILVFSAVNFAWVFFRSETLSTSVTLIKNSFDIFPLNISFYKPNMLKNFILILILLIVHLIEQKTEIVKFISNKPLVFRWGIYYIAVVLFIVFGNFGINEFIYFQF